MVTLIAYLNPAQNGPGDQSEGHEDHREAITAWARRRRHQVTAFIEEDEPTGLIQRPGLASAIAALHDDGVAGLVVTSLSTLSEDLVVQEQLLGEIRRTGAKVYSLDPRDSGQLGRVPADPSRSLVREVLKTAAETEPALAAIRSAVRGTPRGSPPYGYRVENGQLVANPAEQAVLMRIAELRGAGASIREIARVLETEGHRPKRSKNWHAETVRRLVQRTQTPPR